MKIRPVGNALFHADGQREGETDRHDKANRPFSQFCENRLKWTIIFSKYPAIL
jgi:hypothetical protein